jgi:putative FmdB family regulatory protein
VPVYEYLCRSCDTRFEVRRPMSEAAAPMACPDGHQDTTRLLSVFASVGRDSRPTSSDAAIGSPREGGCGPGCACVSATGRA